MEKNNKGFSLIELSIVLIIMGLLVAGITGGANLIKSAQLRSVITEYNNQKTNYNTFFGQMNRVPGSGSEVGDDPSLIVSSQNAWDELKAEGMIDRTATDGFLASKFKKTFWYFNTQSDTAKAFPKLNVMIACGKDTTAPTTILDGKEARNILSKIDDGTGNNGSVWATTGTGGTLLDGDGVDSPVDGTAYILITRMDF